MKIFSKMPEKQGKIPLLGYRSLASLSSPPGSLSTEFCGVIAAEKSSNAENQRYSACRCVFRSCNAGDQRYSACLQYIDSHAISVPATSAKKETPAPLCKDSDVSFHKAQFHFNPSNHQLLAM
ncbi:hypothetical protein [Paenibacillus sp. HB172176]|uniref:hypothetical protein n=1 Tax=Paenibacillus sp. HB172176 TaxID=2493690 RepID=UPI0014394A1C|nr:hypothetical protein [Paenibacillus sp. HB172176]